MATNTETATSQKTVSITRTFDLPAKKLWQAWTEPESFKKWWGPKDYTCPYGDIDLKVGGKYLACMRSNDGAEFWSTGVYKEIIPDKKIVCTDSFSDEKGNVIPASDLNMPGDWPMELLVTVTFEEAGGKTKMHLQQVGIPAEMYDECILGWEQSLDKLEENIK
jgi:uncharacterized protein YndB with AHSA1/START domain